LICLSLAHGLALNFYTRHLGRGWVLKVLSQVCGTGWIYVVDKLRYRAIFLLFPQWSAMGGFAW
jgi:hypothetical protein